LRIGFLGLYWHVQSDYNMQTQKVAVAGDQCVKRKLIISFKIEI